MPELHQYTLGLTPEEEYLLIPNLDNLYSEENTIIATYDNFLPLESLFELPIHEMSLAGGNLVSPLHCYENLPIGY